MGNPPLISIALCTYNGGEFLGEQLDSILGQRFTDWELIVVDDCSKDNTRDILQSYANREPRMQLHYNQTNLGYNKNFEKALRLCRSPLIAICDQDDIWHPEKLEKQVGLMPGHTLVYHDSEFIDSRGQRMNRRISDKLNLYSGSDPEAFLFLNCVSGHSILMQNSVLQHALPFPEGFHYDQWLAFQASCLGRINFVPEALVQYRQHARNSTDLLALKTVKRQATDKVREMELETGWLEYCARRCHGKSRGLIAELARESARRNSSLLHVAYGRLIWKNRGTLLTILKKSDTSKFFYTLRKIWGAKVKLIGK